MTKLTVEERRLAALKKELAEQEKVLAAIKSDISDQERLVASIKRSQEAGASKHDPMF